MIASIPFPLSIAFSTFGVLLKFDLIYYFLYLIINCYFSSANPT